MKVRVHPFNSSEYGSSNRLSSSCMLCNQNLYDEDPIIHGIGGIRAGRRHRGMACATPTPRTGKINAKFRKTCRSNIVIRGKQDGLYRVPQIQLTGRDASPKAKLQDISYFKTFLLSTHRHHTSQSLHCYKFAFLKEIPSRKSPSKKGRQLVKAIQLLLCSTCWTYRDGSGVA